jgi:peroxiredoxin
MQALATGKRAPDFSLPTMDGGQFSLSDTLKRGPAVLVFFKISCPVCQFALPFFERIYQAAKGKSVTIIGVSQNSKKDTDFFKKQYGITLPIALDDPKGYPASNAYGLTNVPTIFYVNQDGNIEISAVGWSRADVEEIARKISSQNSIPTIPFIKPGEEVPAFRAG